MSETIGTNMEAVESDAAQIEKAADFLQAVALNPKDDRTTLSVNGNLHEAFDFSQTLKAALGAAVDGEAANIRSTGTAFEQYDQMLASLAQEIAK